MYWWFIQVEFRQINRIPQGNGSVPLSCCRHGDRCTLVYMPAFWRLHGVSYHFFSSGLLCLEYHSPLTSPALSIPFFVLPFAPSLPWAPPCYSCGSTPRQLRCPPWRVPRLLLWPSCCRLDTINCLRIQKHGQTDSRLINSSVKCIFYGAKSAYGLRSRCRHYLRIIFFT